MVLDILAKFPAVIAALIAAAVAVPSWWATYRTQRRQTTKAELDALLAAAEGAQDDEAYRRFLLELYKEKLIGLALGRSVPLDQIGMVMALHGRSDITAEEIGLAWPYRNRKAPSLSFDFDGTRWAWYWAVNLYVVSCWLVTSLTLGCLFLPISASLRWQLAAQSICFALLSLGAVWMNRGLYMARHLAKKLAGSSPRSENLARLPEGAAVLPNASEPTMHAATADLNQG